MTLKKIAEMAGVSVSTVSRVVNSRNPKCASQEVQNRIWAAVRSLGYTPNSVAQGLKKNDVEKSARFFQNAITYCCSESFLQEGSRDWELLSLLEKEILDNHFAVDTPHVGQSDVGAKIKSQGLVLIGAETDRKLGQYLEKYRNIVNIIHRPSKPLCDVVLLDTELTVRSAWSHLTGLGHTRILFAGAKWGELSRSYDTIFKDSHQPVEFFPCGLSMSDGILLVNERFQRPAPPTALVCEDNAIACGAVQALRARSIAVPDDVSVVSLGGGLDLSHAEQSNRVTTFTYSKANVSRLAVNLLIDRIHRGHKLNVICEPGCEIEDNGSCAPVRRRA